MSPFKRVDKLHVDTVVSLNSIYRSRQTTPTRKWELNLRHRSQPWQNTDQSDNAGSSPCSDYRRPSTDTRQWSAC